MNSDANACDFSFPVFNQRSKYSQPYFLNDYCCPRPCNLVATWNVEGCGLNNPAKLYQIQAIRAKMGIGIMCVQETHIKGCPYFESDGFLIIYSGCEESQKREYAGVGFIIAPHMKSAVKSFMQLSSRIAILKLRIKGGIAH